MSNGKLKVFSGGANPELAAAICEHVGIPQGDILLTTFSDGEVYCQILENVRGRDVFILQPTCNPVNTTLMELLIMIDAFKRASAKRVTAVIPYFGYARQDRKDRPRVPISSKMVANLLEATGADRILTMDLHAPQIQGFFDIPVDHLFATPVLVRYIHELNIPDMVIVSPDSGGVERARAIAKRLDSSLAVIDKRRSSPNVADVMHVIGEVEGRRAIIVDDMIDTAGTLTKVAKALIEEGALSVMAAAAHAVLSGNAIERIENSPIDKVIVSNSIPLTEAARKCEKIEQLSVAELLGDAIRSIHEETSVSSLFI
ncbi:MAG TPA: ribose-phosphate pyrophosphokinase [Acidobacteriota bacterium]|nr:ribose-phosphate pyrophosphokinase [Acidobacteriota bacterium]